MRRFAIFCSLLFIGFGVFAQPKIGAKVSPDSTKSRTGAGAKKHSMHKKLTLAADSLTLSDYMISIERVNDNLNTIRDSTKLGFEVVRMGRKIVNISDDIKIIRQNIRDKRSALNMKNLYLYQSFASNLDEENDRLQTRVNRLYKKVYHGKKQLKTVLSDSVFRVLYADTLLRNTFDDKLLRLERKWTRTDSVTKANIDSLNILKVKLSDNSLNLSNMLNMMDNRIDRAGSRLLGHEVNNMWQEVRKDLLATDSTKKAVNILISEHNAIGYYFSQTSGERVLVFILGILLFTWLFLKRKLLKKHKKQKDLFGFLRLQYLNSHPVFSILILLLCLMPFFDAYAPTSYIAIEFIFLLGVASVIFAKNAKPSFLFYWVGLVILFVVCTITYIMIEPTLVARLWMLILHVSIIAFSFGLYRQLNKEMAYYKWIRAAVFTGMILAGLGVFCNLFGRFSLSGIVGLSAIFAVTQALVLPVFIDTCVEIILMQLQSRRLNKGVNKPFDDSSVIKRTKGPLLIVAAILWLIMLTSNLNIYHDISNYVVEFLTVTRTIGSISFKLISLLLFFAIIWVAHLLQRLISFLFGETGTETEDTAAVSKGQHSRLLITRLLVLIGGYLLAIAASGLPIDKLTFLLGALGVGIGMGLQNVVNNFVSGIILIFDGSLQIGDQIEVNNQAGKVKEIGLRASTLTTSDGADVIIPNGDILSHNIVNWTFNNDQKRVIIEFSLSGKELDVNVINEVINETIKQVPNVVAQRKAVILFHKVTHQTSSLSVRFWTTINSADQVKSEVIQKLSTAFSEKNIGFE